MWSILALKLSLGRCVDLTGAARQETQRVRNVPGEVCNQDCGFGVEPEVAP
jgi:hypothetical protein